jgi:hypothetical protein
VRRLARLTVMTLTLTGLSLLLGACSASVGTTDKSSPGPKTYANEQYGFTMTYDGQLEEGKSTSGSGAGGSSVFDVTFAAKDGPQVGGNYANGMQISVYKLARKVKAAEVPKFKKEVSGVVARIMASLPSARIDQPVEGLTVNGVPGFGFSYSYAQDGTKLKGVSFFLFKGQNEYQLTAQAAAADWETLKTKLEGAFQTFTIK